MWNTAVKQLGVVCATSYIYVVPLITLLTSAIVIDETITIVALLGSALILSGVYCRKGSELEEINSVGNCFNFLSLRFSMKSSLWLHSTLFQEELH